MNDNYIELWYLGTPYRYKAQNYIDRLWTSEWYARVFKCPVSEMLSKTSHELAEELLMMVNDSGWTKQYKRSMRLGDRFTIGDVDWVFASTKDAATFKTAGLTVIQLPAWPDTIIVQVPRT